MKSSIEGLKVIELHYVIETLCKSIYMTDLHQGKSRNNPVALGITYWGIWQYHYNYAGTLILAVSVSECRVLISKKPARSVSIDIKHPATYWPDYL